MKIKSASIFLVALFTVSGAEAADLLDILHLAEKNDPVIAAARAAQQAGREKLPQGRSLILPSVNLTANSASNELNTQYKGPFPFPSGNSRYNSNGYGVTLVQPLYRQQNWISYSEAELLVVQTDAQFKLAEQNLVLRTALAYFDMLLAQDAVKLAHAQKAAIDEQLAQARRNFEVGTATITDTDEALARHDLTYSQEIAAENNLEIKRSALQQIISVLPPELKTIGAQFKLAPPSPADMEKWVSNAELQSPDLASARAGVELAEKEVEKSRDGHYPTVDMVANYARNSANGGGFGIGTDTTSKSIGVQLNLPIYQGGAVNSKWREAEANREHARQDMENARRTVVQQTREAYLGVVSGIAQVKALQQALISSASVLEASKLGHEVGVRTNLDVLNAEQQLYSTRRDLYQAEYNYLLSQLRLKASVGELDETELAVVNQALH